MKFIVNYLIVVNLYNYGRMSLHLNIILFVEININERCWGMITEGFKFLLWAGTVFAFALHILRLDLYFAIFIFFAFLLVISHIMLILLTFLLCSKQFEVY